MKNNFILFLLCLTPLYLFGQKERTIVFESRFDIYSQGETNRLRLVTKLPNNVQDQQKVDTILFNKTPARIFSEDEETYAEFLFEDSFKKEELKITTHLTIYHSDFKVLQKKRKNQSTTPPSGEFLRSELYLECDDEEVQKVARQLQNKDQIKTVRNIYKYVAENMVYSGYNPLNVGVKEIITTNQGDCTEFTDLFVTLCRACDIPARHVTGYIASNVTMAKHSWGEAYIDKIGWIPFEVTSGHQATFNNRANNYIRLSGMRTDPVISNSFCIAWTYWGSPISVMETYYVKDIVK